MIARVVALAVLCAALFLVGASRSVFLPMTPLAGPSPTGAVSAPAPASGTPRAEPTASTGALATSALRTAKFTYGGVVVTLPIEVPPASEYEIGLSGRRSLDGRGMLFAFPDGLNVGFWMKGTHIDLDIAFVDASMRVIDVQTMRAESLDVHKPPSSYVVAVEAPVGWYAAHGVKTGAQVAFDIDLKTATGR